MCIYTLTKTCIQSECPARPTESSCACRIERSSTGVGGGGRWLEEQAFQAFHAHEFFHNTAPSLQQHYVSVFGSHKARSSKVIAIACLWQTHCGRNAAQDTPCSVPLFHALLDMTAFPCQKHRQSVRELDVPRCLQSLFATEKCFQQILM